jgi:hypothetical protein
VFDWRRQFGPALDQTIFGLERHDPLVMSGAAAILALVAIVAALVPAIDGAHERGSAPDGRHGPASLRCQLR